MTIGTGNYQQLAKTFATMSDNKQVQLPLLPGNQGLFTGNQYPNLAVQANLLAQQSILLGNAQPLSFGNLLPNQSTLLPQTPPLTGLVPPTMLTGVDLDKRWLQNVTSMQPAIPPAQNFDRVAVYPFNDAVVPQKPPSSLTNNLSELNHQTVRSSLKRNRASLFNLPVSPLGGALKPEASAVTQKTPPKKKRRASARPCEMPGCKRLARSSTPYCAGHGGGLRCKEAGCNKAARGKSLLCIAHGGGKRCQTPNCTKSAQGATNHCIAHGGGKRCKHPNCNKSARAKEGFCKAHSVERRKSQIYASNVTNKL